ncbi:hypothetical protein PUNSTDRAFT_138434 [Punctularia strigosozonata HHB-11173 SS5]|uniref:HNH nuclease domain-containing protein n=1 Tax=Punctularia strigosozonata (strain HHB-11173) TaxID=741275 RepID=R7S4L4_PUNST|nr:uncharacterized protein PUNSTDRAFT_138434 [Punctularia strigosozonata HHB-11173 SS5]EIN04789.1 hypothetical protein PUNSTDRAFT_138434 [Punctularia strigosozonata HHB-11173 SS5]
MPRKHGGTQLLRDLEIAWRYTLGEYNRDTRWAQIYLCLNWHWEFNNGGWSILPSLRLLDRIYSELRDPKKREKRSSYLEWRSKLRENKPVPPEYCFIPLKILSDNRPVVRHNGRTERRGEMTRLQYDHIWEPYKDIPIDLPLHPFPLIAHFNTAWSMLTPEEKEDVENRLDQDHRLRVEVAQKIWSAWHQCTPPPVNTGAGPGPDGGPGGGDGGPGGGGHEDGPRRSTRNSKKSQGKGNNKNGQGSTANRPRPTGKSLNDSMMTAASPTMADSCLDYSAHDTETSATSSVEVRSDQRDDSSLSTVSETAESDDDDYNPLPELAPRVWIDIDGWAVQIKEGEEFLRGRGKPPAPPRTSPKWNEQLARYMEEGARSPPHDPDWTRWEADTHCKWQTALRPAKRRRTVE